VGEAFTCTVTLAALDVPGMLLPPLPSVEVEGLAVYPKPPQVQDQVERGDLTGKRIESVTYVCERPGRFTLPAVIMPWWDLKHQQVVRATLPAVTFEVEPGPVQSSEAAGPPTVAHGLRWVLGIASLTAAATAVLWYKRRALAAAWERRRLPRQASESGLFTRLLDACRANDARTAYNGLLHWLDARYRGPEAATIEAFLVHHPNADLRRQVETLQEVILGRATQWDGVALADRLRQARRRERQGSRRSRAEGRLPDLNPR
jgi:hypothetical protein